MFDHEGRAWRGAQIHYELFIRKAVGGAWTLDMATEDRGLAVKSAEEMMKAGKVVAVRVNKETLDPETREFRSVSILTLGAAEPAKKAQPERDNEPLCFTPQDLYTAHARERIGRLLDALIFEQFAHWNSRLPPLCVATQNP